MTRAPARLAHALLLDLDGTLLDTAPDMSAALNEMLREAGREALAAETIRHHVGYGTAALIRLGFGTPPRDEFERLSRRFLEIYSNNVSVHTRLFDGFEGLLRTLEIAGIPWGVVTNKPGYLTAKLLAAQALNARASCVVAGDTVSQQKPHPLPLLHAASLISRSPADCLYVGDAERDIQAGRAAGMQTVVARFGYLGPTDDPHSWGPDWIIDDPRELSAWLALPA